MKKINNNLPRGGAEWGRALRRFLSDNIVPIMFVLICAYCIPRADLSWNYLLNEGMTRLGRNAFLILSLLIPVMAGMGMNFGMTLGAMAGQIGLIFAAACLFILWFRRTKLGQDMRAVGQDMEVARDAGINVERTRVISMVISTVFAGFGMIIYLQNVGNFPTYTAHTQIGMFSIAALLVGGASVEKASIKNVFLGVILFHTMFIVAPRTGTVITGDSMIGEYFRVFVSYAVITIALVMYEAKKRKAKSAAGLQLAADQLAEEEAKAK